MNMQLNTLNTDLPYSASFKRFLEDTEEIRQRFLNPTELDEDGRRKLYCAIRLLINRTRIRCMDGIWMYDASERLTENHYAAAFLDNLEYLEFDAPEARRIIPGKTTLVEVSTGSAGIAFAAIGNLLGFAIEVSVPPLEPARKNSIEEIVRSVRSGVILDPSRDAEVTDGYLNDAIGRMQSRALSPEGRAERKAQELALPNHAEVKITPQSFRTIAKDALGKLENDHKVIPDAIVMALGNGTSVEGMVMELQSQTKYENVQLFGFEGMHNPGVYQRLHGPLSDAEREDRVTLYGADGTYNLSNFAKGFSSINTLFEQGHLTKENTTTISRETCEHAFETLNRGQKRRDTVGRTTAAAWHYAKQLQAHGFQNILFLCYDKADRYGDVLVTEDDAVYTGNGEWSPEGVRLEV